MLGWMFKNLNEKTFQYFPKKFKIVQIKSSSARIWSYKIIHWNYSERFKGTKIKNLVLSNF
jgi:hypothetical protein